jgi:hypothetical protein
MDSGIKPLDTSFFVAGSALTVDARPGDNLILYYALTMPPMSSSSIVDAAAASALAENGEPTSIAPDMAAMSIVAALVKSSSLIFITAILSAP